MRINRITFLKGQRMSEVVLDNHGSSDSRSRWNRVGGLLFTSVLGVFLCSVIAVQSCDAQESAQCGSAQATAQGNSAQATAPSNNAEGSAQTCAPSSDTQAPAQSSAGQASSAQSGNAQVPAQSSGAHATGPHVTPPAGIPVETNQDEPQDRKS